MKRTFLYLGFLFILSFNSEFVFGNGLSEVAVVSTFKDLDNVAPIRLESGWEVRLGMSDGGEEAGPWMFIYCLAHYDNRGSGQNVPSIPFGREWQILGPLAYNVTYEKGDNRKAWRSSVIPKTGGMLTRVIKQAVRGRVLFVNIVPLPKKGKYYLEVLAPDGKPIQNKTIIVKSISHAYWRKFILLSKLSGSSDEGKWGVDRDQVAVYPRFDGMQYIHGETLQRVLRQNSLPGKIPHNGNSAERGFLSRYPLRLSIAGNYLNLRSKRKIYPSRIEDQLLVRWWLNDKPVIPKCLPTKRTRYIVFLEFQEQTSVKIRLGFPTDLNGLRVGDKVGLQALYSPNGCDFLLPYVQYEKPKTLVYYDIGLEPVLSNRLDIIVDRNLLPSIRQQEK